MLRMGDENEGDIRKFLICCVRRREVVPECMFLNGVEKTSRDPVAHGGFANIWKGTYLGKEVAIKSVRVHGGVDFTSLKKVRGCYVNSYDSTQLDFIYDLIIAVYMQRSDRLAPALPSQRTTASWAGKAQYSWLSRRKLCHYNAVDASWTPACILGEVSQCEAQEDCE